MFGDANEAADRSRVSSRRRPADAYAYAPAIGQSIDTPIAPSASLPAGVSVVVAFVVVVAFAVAAIAAALTDDAGSADLAPTTAAAASSPTLPELREVSATTAGGRVSIEIVLADGGVSDGAEIFVWALDPVAGPGPIRLLRHDGAWTIADDTSASIEANDAVVTISLDRVPAGIAVSTTGVDRVPGVGHIAPDPDGGSTAVVDGAGAAEIERSVAEVERGFGVLNPLQRELAVSLLARQMITGTWSYDVRSGDGSTAMAVVSVRYPELSQVVDGRSGLYASRDGAQSCSVNAGVGTCHPSSLVRFPAGAAAALARSPLEVGVVELTAGEPDGDGAPTRCLQVTSSLVDGPSPGRWCWATDGTVVAAELDNGTVTTLESKSDLDGSLLLVPGA